MLKRIAACALLLTLVFCAAASATDATAAWNNVAGTYSFLRTDQAALGTTFAQAYTGSNFSGDFAAIKASVSSVCGSPIMDPDGDEVMSDHLEHWN